MIAVNIIKWVNASINKYFDDNKGSYPLYIQGQPFDPIKNQSWCELHISVGPDVEETTAANYDVYVTVTLMCSAVLTNDVLLIHKITGYFMNLASQAFEIKKYGDGNALIACIQPIDKIRMIQWGEIQVQSGMTPMNVNQTHIEAQYYLTF